MQYEGELFKTAQQNTATLLQARSVQLKGYDQDHGLRRDKKMIEEKAIQILGPHIFARSRR